MLRNATKLFCIVLLLCALVSCGVHDNQIVAEQRGSSDSPTFDDSTLPPGLYLKVEDLPSIAEFSASGYEDRQDQFPSIIAVRYMAQGNSTAIPINDGRVFRLINFIGKSFEEGSFGMQFGYVETDEIEQWYADSEPMLEITFQSATDVKRAAGFGLCTKLLIRGGIVLKLLDGRIFDDDAERGVLLCPYNTLLEDGAKYMSYPEKERWIDLLVYAGFINQSEDD